MKNIELTEKAMKNHDVWFPGLNGALTATDPDLNAMACMDEV